jgi:hypothetical protein
MGPMKAKGLMAVLPWVLVLAGCGGPEAPSGSFGDDREATAAALRSAQQHWASHRPSQYAATMRRVCFCPAELNAPARVTVHGATVVSAQSPEGAAVDTERFLSVDQQLALVEQAIAEGAYEIQVTYDSALAYPTSVYVDQSAGVADEEIRYETSDLTPTS